MRISDWSSDVCSSDLVDKMARNGGGRSHGRTDQMRSTALPLTAFKIAVRGGRATLAGLQTIGVHGQTHRASWFAPLEAGLNKYLVQTFLFGLQDRKSTRLNSSH